MSVLNCMCWVCCVTICDTTHSCPVCWWHCLPWAESLWVPAVLAGPWEFSALFFATPGQWRARRKQCRGSRSSWWSWRFRLQIGRRTSRSLWAPPNSTIWIPGSLLLGKHLPGVCRAVPFTSGLSSHLAIRAGSPAFLLSLTLTASPLLQV